MGEVAERMRAKLVAALAPTRLELVDDSHRHAGQGQHQASLRVERTDPLQLQRG